MKKFFLIVLLGLGLFLIAGTLYVNLSYAAKVLNRINVINFFPWLLGFALDFLTNPAGLLGLVLSVFSIWKLRHKK